MLVVFDNIVQHCSHAGFVAVHAHRHAQRMQDVGRAVLVRLVSGMGIGGNLDRQGQRMNRRPGLQILKSGEQGIEFGQERRGF